MFEGHHHHHGLEHAWHLFDDRFREAFPHLHFEHLRPTLGPDPGLNIAHSIKHLWRAIRCLEEAEIMGQKALAQLANDLGNLLQVIEQEVTNNVENWITPQLNEIEEDLNEIWEEIGDIWEAIKKLGGTPPDPSVAGDTTLANMEYIELNTPFSNMQVLRSPQSSVPVTSATLKDNICHNNSFYDRESGLTFTWNRNFQDNSNGVLPPVLFCYNVSGLYIKELIPGDTNGIALPNTYTIDDVFVSTIVDSQKNVSLIFEISFLNEELIMYQVPITQIINHDPSQSLTQYIIMTDINSQATYNHVIGAPTKFNSMLDFMAQEVIMCSYKSGTILKGTRNDLYNNAMLTTVSQPWLTFGEGVNPIMGMNKASASNDGNWLVVSNGTRLQSLWADWGATPAPTDYMLYEDTPATTIYNNILSRLYQKTKNLDFNSSGKVASSNQALNIQIVPFSSNYPSSFNMDLFVGLKIAPTNGFDVSTNTSYYQFTNQGWTSAIQTNANNNAFVSSEYLNGARVLAMYSRKALYTIKANLFSLMTDKPTDINNNNSDFPTVAQGVPYQSPTPNGATPLPFIEDINSHYTGLGSQSTDDWTLEAEPYNRWGYFTQVLYHGKDPMQVLGSPFDDETTIMWYRQNRFGLHYNAGTSYAQTQIIGQWSKIDMDEYMDWRNRVNARLAEYDLQFAMIQGDITWLTNEIMIILTELNQIENTDVANHLSISGNNLILTRKLINGTPVGSDTVPLPTPPPSGVTSVNGTGAIEALNPTSASPTLTMIAEAGSIPTSGYTTSIFGPIEVGYAPGDLKISYNMQNASTEDGAGWSSTATLKMTATSSTVSAGNWYSIGYSIGGAQYNTAVGPNLNTGSSGAASFDLSGIDVSATGIFLGVMNVTMHNNVATINSGTLYFYQFSAPASGFQAQSLPNGNTGVSINSLTSM